MGARRAALRGTGRRTGFSLVWSIVCLVALLAFVSLAVDFGRAQTVKTELRRAADAAARYAVTGLGDSTYATRAIDAADDNLADGSPVIITAGDVVRGSYDPTTRVFTPAGSPTNAAQVTCGRTGANGVPLLFARALGIQNINVSAVAIAYATPRLPAFTGVGSVDMKNNSFFGSYDSSTLLNPSQASATNTTGLGSNGAINGIGHNNVLGNVTLGPVGTIAGVTVTGTTTTATSPMIPPADPAWNPSGNPGGVAQSYTASGTVSLPGGTYWFTALVIDGDLSFTAPATLYVNGDVTLDGSLTASGQVPGNLKVYQLGSGRHFGDSKGNNITIVAVISAPGSDFAIKNNLRYLGAGVFNTITTRNNADFFYDQKLGSGGAGGTNVSIVR